MKRLSDDPLVRLEECRGEPMPPAGEEVEVTNDACKQRFTTWIDQKMGGAMLGEVVVAEYHDNYICQLQADMVELRGTQSFRNSLFGRVETERDALKAEVERLTSQKGDPVGSFDKHMQYMADNATMQSRLTQATAIIDYLWLHTKLDALAKSDIDKFYAGSTDAEKAARAEMVRVANEPAGDGGYTDYDLHKDGE